MAQHSEFSIAETSHFLAQQIDEWAQQSAVAILEGHRNKFIKLLHRFSISLEQKRQRSRLSYHLFIAYLTVAAVELQRSTYFRSYSQEIIDGIVELFYESFKTLYAVGDDFIRDVDEKEIIRVELRRNDANAFGSLSRLPTMGLTAIMNMLLEKRLNEYRQIWISDLEREGQPGYMPLMPSKVYQHWSGENPRSWQSVTFTIILHSGLAPFSTAIGQALQVIKIRRE